MSTVNLARLNDLLDKLGVTPKLREECFHELVVAALEGKTEQQMVWTVIYHCKRSKSRLVELNERLRVTYYLPEEDDTLDEVAAILEYWMKQGALTPRQSHFLWRHILGDPAYLIAEEEGVNRTTVYHVIRQAVRNLRRVFGVEETTRAKKEVSVHDLPKPA